jgi:hypothetical protein
MDSWEIAFREKSARRSRRASFTKLRNAAIGLGAVAALVIGALYLVQ